MTEPPSLDQPASLTPPSPTRSLPTLVGDGLLDAELAALAWLLLDARVPLLVVAPPIGRFAAAELAGAFGALLPPDAGRAVMAPDGVGGDPAADTFVGGWLTGGDLRRAVRGVARGFGLVGATEAGSLEELLARLGAISVGASAEMIARLGVILVLGGTPPHPVEAAHYLRPVARDAGGHVQHLAPAVLATADGRGGWDHFAWGLYPELAYRTGIRAGDLERQHEARTEILATLVRSGVVDSALVRATLNHARGHGGGGASSAP